MEATGLLDPLRVEPPRRGHPLTSPAARGLLRGIPPETPWRPRASSTPFGSNPRVGEIPLTSPRGALTASLEPFVPDLRRVIGENSPLPLCYAQRYIAEAERSCHYKKFLLHCKSGFSMFFLLRKTSKVPTFFTFTTSRNIFLQNPCETAYFQSTKSFLS